MNSITKISLENFQSHVKTTVEPAAGGCLSVITGPSDSGKTAIIRALKWLFFNAPAGTDFIRAGATYSKIVVEFETGDTVTRWRTIGGINRYLVNAEVYEGFGNDVPLEVRQLSELRELTIGDIELNLNISEQLQGPFLGRSVSAPTRAKVLGKLAGTEEIDLAGKRLGTDLYRRNQDEKRLKGNMAELKEKIAGYDYLPAMKRKIGEIETQVAAVRKAIERRLVLADLRTAYSKIETGMVNALVTIRQWRGLDQAGLLVSDVEQTVEKKHKVQALGQKHFNVILDIERCEQIMVRRQGVEEAEQVLQAVARAQEHRMMLFTLTQKLEQVATGIHSAWSRITKYRHIEAADAQLNAIQKADAKVSKLRLLTRQYIALAKQEQESLKKVLFYEERLPVIGSLLRETGDSRRLPAVWANH